MHALLLSLGLSSLGLMIVLSARTAARRAFGAGPAFTLWLLPPLLAAAPWLPTLAGRWPMPVAVAAFPGASKWLQPAMDVAVAPAATHGFVWAWIAGSTLLLTRLMLHYCRVRQHSCLPCPQLLQALRALTDGRELSRVRTHPLGPAVLWSPRSLLLLPADFPQRFTPAQQRAVFAHECMHLRRGDAWWSLLAELGLALLWFHPLAWLALPRLRLDMELACDAAVLRRHPRSHAEYAQALLSNAGVQARPSLVSWLNPPQLKERLTMISRPQSSSTHRRCSYFLIAMALVIGTFSAQAFSARADGAGSTAGTTIELTLAGDGAVSWNGQPLSASQLQQRLATAAARKPQPQVMISLRASAPFERVYTLLRSVKQSGIARAGFRTEVGTTADGTSGAASVDKVSRGQHPPRYPVEAQRQGAQGSVTLRVHVDAAGTPTEIRIAQSSGNRALDRAAISAAQQWRFNPAVHDSKATAGWVRTSVNFSLDR